MTSLRQVLGRLRSAKLTAKPPKRMTEYNGIECLGHNIVDQTVGPQEGQDTDYQGWSTPYYKKANEILFGIDWILLPLYPKRSVHSISVDGLDLILLKIGKASMRELFRR